MEIILHDPSFYNHSGGDLTLSGGEPLAQPHFTREFLRAAKEHGLHTYLGTCGEAPQSAFEEILPWVDLFLFDYKMTNRLEHRALTGMDNRRILANFDSLYSRDARIRLRYPLVPGINDTNEHLRGIATLSRMHPKLAGVELMPFHTLGHHKYARYGLPDPLPGLPDTPEVTLKGWLATLRNLGCEAGCNL